MPERGAKSGKFLFVGNHPCLDFINTEIMQGGRRVDLLGNDQDLLAWIEEAGLTDRTRPESVTGRGELPVSEQTFQQAKTFRTVLRETVKRIVTRNPVSSSSVEAINEMLAHRTGSFELVRTRQGFTRQFHTDSSRDTWILGILAEAAADLLSNADLSLVKKCKNSACILYFYDTTKNHTRNWCSMGLCGNRMKVAAHYRRMRSRKR
jgi:predicted RNA-binding Zn ribbon-like protein